MSIKPRPLAERFEGKYIPEPMSGCWLWLGSCMKDGYGHISAGNGKFLPAHRAAYEIWVGPIPEGMWIDHLCRNPYCVNPKHLEAVTPRENTMRGNGLSAQNARKTHCSKGHPYSGHNLFFVIDDGRLVRKCRECNRLNSQKIRDRRKYARMSLV